MKRVGDGETHWHADLAMAPLDTNALVTCWIPLQPVPAEASGGSGLVFAGGPHRLGLGLRLDLLNLTLTLTLTPTLTRWIAPGRRATLLARRPAGGG